MTSANDENEEKDKTQSGWLAASARIEKSLGYFQSNAKSLKDEERTAFKNIHHNGPYVFVLNNIATVIVFMFHLISLETLISISLSIALTVVLYNKTEDSSTFDGGIMSWTLLSFAIITPLSSTINMAFGRREKGLDSIKKIKTYLFGLYQAHVCWDWGKLPTTGREKSKTNWLNHSDAVLGEMKGFVDDMTSYLTFPTMSRARHRLLSCHKESVESSKLVSKKLLKSVYSRITRISLFCEALKLEGLPPNEATRIRQWELIIVNEVSKLEYIKNYRTPQALRSLCRVFSVIMPPFYAPFYAQLARELNSLGMGITFSVMTSLVLTALFECATGMEDPFGGRKTLDGIDVKTVLRDDCMEQLTDLRDFTFFPNAGKGGFLNGFASSDVDLEVGIGMK